MEQVEQPGPINVYDGVRVTLGLGHATSCTSWNQLGLDYL